IGVVAKSTVIARVGGGRQDRGQRDGGEGMEKAGRHRSLSLGEREASCGGFVASRRLNCFSHAAVASRRGYRLSPRSARSRASARRIRSMDKFTKLTGV